MLGVLSLCFGFLTGIPAAICGVLGLTKANQVGSGKGMALTGIILGVVGTILTAVGGYLAYSGTKEVVNKVEQAAGGARANNDLKEIGLGALNHCVLTERLKHLRGLLLEQRLFAAVLPDEPHALQQALAESLPGQEAVFQGVRHELDHNTAS